jgi:hypothetical protein
MNIAAAHLAWTGRRPALARALPALLAAACTSHPLAAPPPQPEVQTSQTRQVDQKLDLLFVVDNSGSMTQEQASLARNFPLFMRELEEAGLPDLHLGIVSSDFGAGGLAANGCRALGDQGRFRFRAGCGLPEGGPSFLSVDSQGQANFSGALVDAFACLADLGIEGCGYEHQLQSMRTALSPYNPELQAFLRPDARLAIVIVSDEDDCSGDPASELYREDRPAEEASFRCATAGHLCGDREVPASAGFRAPLASCAPREHAGDEAARRQRLINVSEFVRHVQGLKPGRPDRIIVSGVIGWRDDVQVSYAVERGATRPGSGLLDLVPVCTTDAGIAAPALRLKAFTDAFGTNGSWHSICGADLRAAMQQIGRAIVKADSCLAAPPFDTDPTRDGLQPDCVAYQREPPVPGSPAVERAILPCSAGQGTPCWDLIADAGCRGRARVVVQRTETPRSGTLERVSCLSVPPTMP